MKKSFILGLIFIIMVMSLSGCLLPDGEPLTTESVTQRLEERYGAGKVRVKQVDKTTWRISLEEYPDIRFTVKQKIGHGGVVPVPAYTYTDDSMKQVGKLVLPKYFSESDMKHIDYSSGVISMGWNVQSDDEVAELSAKIEEFCADLHQNYYHVVHNQGIAVNFREKVLHLDGDKFIGEAVKWDKTDRKIIEAYMNSRYGAGTYTYKKSDNDVSHEGEIEVCLNDYPEFPFYLVKKRNKPLGKKSLSDTMFEDVSSMVAFKFSAGDYADSALINVEAEHTLHGKSYNGFVLGCHFEWGGESDIISNMQVARKALRKHINQYPMLNYADYPNNQHKVTPPILMTITIGF